MAYFLGFLLLCVGGLFFYIKGPDFLGGNFEKAQELIEEIPSESELIEKKNQVEADLRLLQARLIDAKVQGEEKLGEIQVKIEQAEKAFADTKKALEDLQQAGEDLRGVLE